MQHSLPLAQNLDLRLLGAADVAQASQYWRDAHRLLIAHESRYPGIDKWITRKVAPQIGTSNRETYVGYISGRPVLCAVAKIGSRAKICHLSIAPEYQNSQVGQLMFSLLAARLRRVAQEVHFTLPEGLWASKGDFFQGFGFVRPLLSARQYRRGEAELACSLPLQQFWKAASEKIPSLCEAFEVSQFGLGSGMVLSLKPVNAERILTGVKSIEVRKCFSPRWLGERVALYASEPRAAIVGEARIELVEVMTPETLWEKYGSRIGCTSEEFFQYTGTKGTVYAIGLGSVRPYDEAMPLREIASLIQRKLAPPQSYLAVRNNSIWAQAISVAAVVAGIAMFCGAMNDVSERKGKWLSSAGYR